MIAATPFRFLLISVLALPGVSAAATYSQDDIVKACTRLNNDYVVFRDSGDMDAYGALFTEDAEFVLDGVLKGRQAIVEAARTRWKQALTRHVIRPVQIEATGADTARGHVYLTLYAAPRPAPDHAGPVAFSGATAVADYRDHYRMTAQGCRFQRREVNVIFARQSAPDDRG